LEAFYRNVNFDIFNVVGFLNHVYFWNNSPGMHIFAVPAQQKGFLTLTGRNSFLYIIECLFNPLPRVPVKDISFSASHCCQEVARRLAIPALNNCTHFFNIRDMFLILQTKTDGLQLFLARYRALVLLCIILFYIEGYHV